MSNCNGTSNMHPKGYVKDSYDKLCKTKLSIELADCVAGNDCYELGRTDGSISGLSSAVTPTMGDCNSGNPCYDAGFNAGAASGSGGSGSTGNCDSNDACWQTGYAVGYTQGGGDATTPTITDCTSGNACYDLGYTAGADSVLGGVPTFSDLRGANQGTVSNPQYSPIALDALVTDDGKTTLFKYVGTTGSTLTDDPTTATFREDGTTQGLEWIDVVKANNYAARNGDYKGRFEVVQSTVGAALEQVTTQTGGFNWGFVVNNVSLDNVTDVVASVGCSSYATNVLAIDSELLAAEAYTYSYASSIGTMLGNSSVLVYSLLPSNASTMSSSIMSGHIVSGILNTTASHTNIQIVLVSPVRNYLGTDPAIVNEAYRLAAKALNCLYIDSSPVLANGLSSDPRYVLDATQVLEPIGQKRFLLWIISQVLPATQSSDLTITTPRLTDSLLRNRTVYSQPREAANILKVHNDKRVDATTGLLMRSVSAVSIEATWTSSSKIRLGLYASAEPYLTMYDDETRIGIMTLTTDQLVGKTRISIPTPSSGIYRIRMTPTGVAGSDAAKVDANMAILVDAPRWYANVDAPNLADNVNAETQAVVTAGKWTGDRTFVADNIDYSTTPIRVCGGETLLVRHTGNLNLVRIFNAPIGTGQGSIVANITGLPALPGTDYRMLRIPAGIRASAMSIIIASQSHPTFDPNDPVEIYRLSPSHTGNLAQVLKNLVLDYEVSP